MRERVYLAAVSLAGIERTGEIVSGHVPVATHDVVDVVAKLLRAGTDAGADAEFVVGDEGSPLVVLQTSAEGVSEYQATNWAPNTLNASPRKRRIIDVLGLPLPTIHTSVTALEDRDGETE